MLHSLRRRVLLPVLIWGAGTPLMHCGGGGDDSTQGSDASTAQDGTVADGNTSHPDSSLPSHDSGGGDTSSPSDSGMGGDTTSANDAGGDAADAGPTTDGSGDNDALSVGGGDAAAEADAADAADAADVIVCPPACEGGLTCCGGQCVNTARDPYNCGGCGNACNPKQEFCTGTQCDALTIANVCANAAVTVIDDQYTADNDAGAEIGNALASICSPPFSLAAVSEDGGGALVPGSGRPNTGVGDAIITAGGSYGQNAVGYMDNAGLTRIYLGAQGDPDGGEDYEFILRSTGSAIVKVNGSVLTAQHDYFVLQLDVEPQTGTLCISAFGFYAIGTAAAGYYVSNQILPNAASYTDAWYAFEWTDTNNDMIPNQGDTFTQKGSGP